MNHVKLNGFLLLLLLFVGHGCTTIPVDERAGVRDEVDRAANESIEQLVALDPSIMDAIEASAGYFAGRVGTTKLPLLGGGYGLGVAFDRQAATRTYLNVTRLVTGAGAYRSWRKK
jgi:hypothetical protein